MSKRKLSEYEDSECGCEDEAIKRRCPPAVEEQSLTEQLLTGDWLKFPGNQGDVCVDLCYRDHPTMPVPVKVWRNKFPDIVRFRNNGEEEMYNIKEEYTDLCKLYACWYPMEQDLPTLPISFEGLWSAKKGALEALGACLSKQRCWMFDRNQLRDCLPMEDRTLVVARLRSQMEKAFRIGMHSGRAKAFVVALVDYLLEDVNNGPLKLYNYQEITVTEPCDCIQGTVRYLGKHAFENNMPLLTKEEVSDLQKTTDKESKKRKSEDVCASDAGSSDTGSTSAVSNVSSRVSTRPAGKWEPYTLTPDCVISMSDHLYVSCVFECTKRTCDTGREEACLQNMREMLSLMRGQRSILGCTINPNGFLLHLAVKNDDRTLVMYRTTEHLFRLSGQQDFHTQELLNLAEFILKVLYTNMRRLKMQGSQYI